MGKLIRTYAVELRGHHTSQGRIRVVFLFDENAQPTWFDGQFQVRRGCYRGGLPGGKIDSTLLWAFPGGPPGYHPIRGPLTCSAPQNEARGNPFQKVCADSARATCGRSTTNFFELGGHSLL